MKRIRPPEADIDKWKARSLQNGMGTRYRSYDPARCIDELLTVEILSLGMDGAWL